MYSCNNYPVIEKNEIATALELHKKLFNPLV